MSLISYYDLPYKARENYKKFTFICGNCGYTSSIYSFFDLYVIDKYSPEVIYCPNCMSKNILVDETEVKLALL